MSKDLKSWILLITLALIWGSSFILMKRGMFTIDGQAIFSDTKVASLRMIIAGIVLLPFAIRSIRILKNPTGPNVFSEATKKGNAPFEKHTHIPNDNNYYLLVFICTRFQKLVSKFRDGSGLDPRK